MNRISAKKFRMIILATTLLFLPSAAWGTELSVPALKARPGESVVVPIMIDQIDNLAGVKLVMKYDTKLLTFKMADKTKASSSLMHIVNDKKPGTLVVVMAGARGIKGKNISILSLRFDVRKDLEKDYATKIEVNEFQMMSDQLKDIKCGIKINPLTISVASSVPAKSGPCVAADQKDESPKASGDDSGPEKPGHQGVAEHTDKSSNQEPGKLGQDIVGPSSERCPLAIPTDSPDTKKAGPTVKDAEQTIENNDQAAKQPDQDVKVSE